MSAITQKSMDEAYVSADLSVQMAWDGFMKRFMNTAPVKQWTPPPEQPPQPPAPQVGVQNG